MKKTKFAAVTGAVLSGILFGQVPALAAVQVDEISSKLGEITVTVSTDSREALTYEVFKSKLEKPEKGDLKGFGEEYPVDGKGTVVFGLKESGEYKIRISDGDETIVDDFVYASARDRERFVEAVTSVFELRDVTQESIEDAADEFHALLIDEENYAIVKTIGVNIEEYLKYSASVQEDICVGVAEKSINKAMTEAKFAELYSETEAVVRINSGSEAMGAETIERLNFEFENVAFDEITDSSKKEWLKKAVIKSKPFESTADIKEAYEKVCALYNISTAKISNIKSVIDGYASMLGITDSKEYKAYKKSANSTVNAELIEEISESMPETVDDFLEALQAAVNAKNESGSGSSGSGGSFGGGGSGVKNNFAIGGTIAPEEKAEVQNQNASRFNDVPVNHWAYTAIDEMQKEGIISGYGDGTFLPDKTVTREEFVKMIVVAFKLENDATSSHFHDVFDSDWFYPYVSAAFEQGIVQGDHLGLFGVNRGITRQDAAVIASRVMHLAGKSTEAERAYEIFGDETVISDYAKEAVMELYCMKKINGTDKGYFEPLRFCTRAEAAMIIYSISR